MEAILESCCGLDVHRHTVVACLLAGSLDQRPRKEIRTFSTMSNGLKELLAWLQSERCTHVAIESTGTYWKPVFQVLEGHFNIKLANAQRIKNVSGRKNDISDAEWIAKLLRSGHIAGSFVPPQDIRTLRELTRHKKKLIQNITIEKNRIQKLLDTAGNKLASAVSDVFGVTGRVILQHLMDHGEIDALDIKLSLHHRFLLRGSWAHLRFLEQSLADIDAQIDSLLTRQVEVESLGGIHGIDRNAASIILPEIEVKLH
ncbi:IS110 family transposase [Effusibacillus consociatus]|uniref:IS110 family transposase n=1 Tax=Effusibacillus consociatus TaxID=1117041 RepID=A0ABV9Q6V2_9BACL